MKRSLRFPLVTVAATGLVAGLLAAPAGANHVDSGVSDAAGEFLVLPNGLTVRAPLRAEHAHAEPDEPGPPVNVPQDARNVSLVGALELEPEGTESHADVWAYEDLAFVGKWRGECPGTGVDIIDVSDPTTPRKIADTRDRVNTSMEDMQAMEIGGRDIMVTGLQDCFNPGPAGKAGLEIYDITDPAEPELLDFFDVRKLVDDPALAAAVVGVHELDLVMHPSGRALALLAVPDLEAISSDAEGLNGVGDMLVLDITNPSEPELLSEFGVLDEFGVEFYLGEQRGLFASVYDHSVRASADGTNAYLSYWDAGVINLDITDPTAPRFVGRTEYPPVDPDPPTPPIYVNEGNAHSIDTSADQSLLIQADEDINPFEAALESSAFDGPRSAAEASGTPPIVGLPGQALEGEIVYVGRGCSAGAVEPGSPPDPYLTNPRGKIALVERGGCLFADKVARAQLAGATGVVLFNCEVGAEGCAATSEDELLTPSIANPYERPDGTVVDIVLPTVFVARPTGLELVDAPAPATARLTVVFNGWGYLRFFDNTNPANPVPISTFATPNTFNPDTASPRGAEGLSGTFTVHNPELVGDTLYASWYADGVRVLDVANPADPFEIGFWRGEGKPAGAPDVDIWGVVPKDGLLYLSDRNFGLYIVQFDEPTLCDRRDVTVMGTAGDDALTGTDGPDVIAGLGGNDTIDAGGGDDVVCAGLGDDAVSGGDGADNLLGGLGADALSGGAGDDLLRGYRGEDTLDGGEGDDTLRGHKDRDVLLGGPGDDFLRGLRGADELEGGDGDDLANGNQDDDVVAGDAGDDVLNGGRGADVLDGGEGQDQCNGNLGADAASGACEVVTAVP